MRHSSCKKNNNKTRGSQKRGFSIIEVLLSAFIFSFGLVSVSNLMLGSLKSSVDTRNQIIAAELSQEGVELIRNFRDNNIAKELSAFNNIPTDGTNLCPRIAGRVSGGTAWISCYSQADGGSALYYGNGTYNYGSANGDATPFLRMVTIDNASPHNVTSMVIWGGASFPTQTSCNIANKCTYTKLSLSEGGWK